jgi:RNA polymerase sigma factor (sigma-70 family)
MEAAMNSTPSATMVSTDPAGDHVIALAANPGDERAFGILFERYQPKIFAVALRYTRVPEDAEDIVQQTFQKAFIHLHTFEGKSSFFTWLTRIAINEALMLRRRRATLREVPIDNSGENETSTHALEIPASDPNPEANYLKREETEALSAAISNLKIGQRTAIELRELAELSTQETARRMGVSVGAAKARIFHGRRKLRKILRSLGITPQGAQPLTIRRVANRSCSSVRQPSRRFA